MPRQPPSTPSKLLKPEAVRRWLRVRYYDPSGPRRLGLLTGVLDRSGFSPTVEVIPEAFAFHCLEFWPLHRLEALPRQQQLRCQGGLFDPPKGYPFLNRRTSP